MNKIFKTLWNYNTQSIVVTSELAKGKSKSSSNEVEDPSKSILDSNAVIFSLKPLVQLLLTLTLVGISSNSFAATGAYEAGGASASANGTTAVGNGANASGFYGTAIGHNAQATAVQSVALGGGNGKTIASGDQSVAIGGDVHAIGSSSIAIGGDDLDRVASKNPPAWNVAGNNNLLNNTDAAQRYRLLTGDNLVDFENGAEARYIKTKTGHGSVALGVSAISGDLATSFGTRARSTGIASVALGVGSTADRDNAIALGAASNTKNAAIYVSSSTIRTLNEDGNEIGSITYNNYAGGSANLSAGDQVSVGSQGFERQIKNVAPGEISQTSTDAINGSQLAIIAGRLQYQDLSYFHVNEGNYSQEEGNPVTNFGEARSKAGAIGDNSVTAGVNAVADKESGIAIGKDAKSKGLQGIAIGRGSDTDNVAGVAIGYNARTLKIADGGGEQVAVGANTTVKGKQSVVVGNDATANGDFTIVIGTQYESGRNKYHSDGNFAVSIGSAGDGGRTIAESDANYSVALGTNAKTITGADHSVAIGDSSVTTGINSLALGHKSKASVEDGIAIGFDAKTDNAVTLNPNEPDSYIGSIAIGRNSHTSGKAAIAMGLNTEAYGRGAVAIGDYADAKSSGQAIAVGAGSISNGVGSIALGSGSKTENDLAVTIGSSSKALVARSVALGTGSVASVSEGAVGVDPLQVAVDKTTSTWTATTSAVSVGNGTTITRQITSLAAGTQDTDAVNVAQLKAAGFKLTTSKSEGEISGDTEEKIKNGDTLTVDAGKNIKLTQAKGKITVATKDEVNFDKVTVGNGNNQVVLDNKGVNVGANTYISNTGLNANNKVIAGVADGTVVENGKEAVNGGQLHTTNQAVTKNTTDIAANATNINKGLNFAGDTGTESNRKLGDKLTIKGGQTDSTKLSANNIGVVSDGAGTLEVKLVKDIVVDSVKAGDSLLDNSGLTINGGPSITKAGINAGNKKITGVEDGAVTAGSKEAVNGGQLHTTNQNVDTNKTNIAKGIKFGNGTDSTQYALGDTLKVKGDVNVTSTNTTDGVQLALAPVISVGKTHPVKIDGDNGVIGGLTNTTFDATAIKSGQAATEDQLKAVSDKATQAATKAKNTVSNGDNIVVNTTTNADGSTNYEVATAKEVNFDKTTVGTGDNQVILDNDGVNVGGKIYINKDGLNANGKKITGVEDGLVEAGSKESVNGGQLYTTNQAVTKNATDIATNATNINKGLNFAGDTGAESKRKLGEKLTIKGGQTERTKLSANNIGVVSDGAGTLEVKLAKNLTGLEAVTIGTGDNQVILDNTGVNVGGKTYISKDGLNANDKVIANVADGTVSAGSKEAINGSQLNAQGEGVKAIIGGKTAYDPATGKYANDDIGGTGKGNISDAIESVSNAAKAAKTVVEAGDNIEVTNATDNKDGHITYTVKTKADVSFDKVTVGNVVVDKATNTVSGLSNKSLGEVGFATKGQAATEEQLNAAQTNLANIVGGDAKNENGTVLATNIGDTGKTTLHEAIKSVKEKAELPLNFAGDSGTEFGRKLSEKVTIKGGVTDENNLSDNNIGVVADAGSLTIKLAKALTGLDSVTSGIVTVGTGNNQVILGNDGVKVGGNTYISDAGLNANDKVITSVALGAISADSKDAVNGSQLFDTNKKVDGNTIALGGGAAYNPDTDTYTKPTYKTVDAAGKAVAGINPADNVGDALTNLNKYVNKGFDVQERGTTKGNVTPTDKINFVDGKLTKAKVTQEANGVTDITFDVDAQGIAETAQLPVVYTNKDGEKLYKQPNGTFNTKSDGTGVEVAKGDIIASMQNADGTTKTPTTLANVKSGINAGDAVNVSQLKDSLTALGGGAAINPDGSVKAPTYTLTDGNPSTDNKKAYNNVGDALNALDTAVNSPLTFTGDSGKFDRKLGQTTVVKGGVTDTDKLSDGNIGVVAKDGTLEIKLAKDLNGLDSVTSKVVTASEGDSQVVLNDKGVNVGGNTYIDKDGINANDKKITNVAPGTVAKDSKDAVNGGQLFAQGEGVKDIIGGNTTYNPDTGTYENTDIGGTGKGNINDAIQSVNTAAKAAKTEVTAGKNIEVTEKTGANGQSIYNVKTAAEVEFDKATVGNVVIDKADDTISGLSNKTLGKDDFATKGRAATEEQLDATQDNLVTLLGGNAKNVNGDVTATDIGGTGKDNLNDAIKAATTEVTSSDGTVLVSSSKNTDGANVYDVKVDAQKLAESAQLPVVYTKADGSKVYKVGDKFFSNKDGSGAEVPPTDIIASMQNADGTTSTATKLANIAKGTNDNDAVNLSQLKGSIAALGGGAKINDDGSLTKPTYTIVKTDGSTVDVNNVGDALTNLNSEVIKPITFVGDAGTDSTRKLGQTLTIKGGQTDASKLSDNNIGVVSDGNGTLEIKLAKDLRVDSVKTGNTTMNNDGITIANADPKKVVSLTGSGLNNGGNKIKNIAVGEDDTDAVNVSQLKAATAAATTKVESADSDKVNVTTVNNNDGSKTYKVNVVTTALTAGTDGTVTTPTKPNSLATAGDIAKAINNAAWKTEAGAGTDGGVVQGKTTELVKAGETVVFDAGKNMKLVQNGQKYTYATKDEVEFTKTTVGSVVTDSTTNKITGLAAGDVSDASTDAINGSQLFDTNNQVAGNTAALGGGAEYDPTTNTYTAPTYTTVDADGNAAILDIAGNPVTADNVGDALKNLNTYVNKGFNVQEKGFTKGVVTPTDSINFVDGSLTKANVTTETDGITNITFDVDAQALTNASQLPVVYTTVDGVKLYKQPDGTFNTMVDGSGLNILPEDIIASMQGADGSTTDPTTLANVKAGVKDTDAVNVSQLKGVAATLGGGAKIADGSDPAVPAGTFIAPKYTITKTDGTTVDANNVGDALTNLNNEVVKPITFAGDTGTNSTRKLGQTLTIKGGQTDASKLSDNNIGVVSDGNGMLEIKLAKDLKVDSVKTGNTTMNNDGITIANTDPNKVISLTGTGLNNGGNKITNVEAGTDDTDAVNVSQLKAATAAATTKVESADADKVNVTTVNNNDGSKTYKVDVVTTALTAGTDGTVDTPTSPNSLATAGDIANAINNAAWKTEAGAGVDGGVVEGKTTELVKAGETVVFDAGKNMKLVQDGQKYTYATKDEVEFTKTTVGSVVTDSATNKITGLAAGDVSDTSTEAVNGSQIKAISDANKDIFGGNATVNTDGTVTTSDIGGTGKDNIDDAIKAVNAAANAGFTIAGNSDAANTTDKQITPNDTLTVVGDANNTDFTKSDEGKNIFTQVSDNKVTVALAKDLDVDSIKAKTVNATDSITIGDVADPDNSTTLTSGANGLDVGGDKITNVGAGDVAQGSTDAANAGQLYEVANTPLTFTGDEGSSAQKLGSTFAIVAGNSTDTSTDNLKTKVENGKVIISMANAPTFSGKVSAKGLDSGGEKITNVAAGTISANSKDAINGSQLYSIRNGFQTEINNLKIDLNNLDKRIRGIGASSAAAASLPQVYIPGKSMVAASVGGYENASAVAVGYSRASDNGKMIIKLQGTVNNQGHVSGGAGVGFQW